MNKTLQIICLTIIISNFSFSQNNEISNDSIKYFDENYKPINEKDYYDRKWKNSLLNIQGDSINHRILSFREEHGILQNKKSLDSLLSSTTNIKVDSSKIIVIIYYPGKDLCNSGGTATKSSINSWYKELEKKLFKIAQIKPIYIYKDNEGLEKYHGILTLYKDPNKTIERLFFKYHYPCHSFVVISQKGNFISYFGEFSKNSVWEAAELMSRI